MKSVLKTAVLSLLLCAGLISASAFAEINWKQSQGTEIRFLMNKHPFTTYIEPKVAEFEKLTGIKVVIEAFPEDQYRNKLTIELNAGGKVDGFMIMPGQDDRYYSKAGWLQPLDAYIADPKLTDPSWNPKDFFASFAKSSSVEGKQIGVVINAETSLLAYRKDLFTKFNQKSPQP
jgi:multiple sugar transport system substrate-binding protein